MATFSKTTMWNIHHLVKHKNIKFRCNECRHHPAIKTTSPFIRNVTSAAIDVTTNSSSTVNLSLIAVYIKDRGSIVVLQPGVGEVINGDMIC